MRTHAATFEIRLLFYDRGKPLEHWVGHPNLRVNLQWPESYRNFSFSDFSRTKRLGGASVTKNTCLHFFLGYSTGQMLFGIDIVLYFGMFYAIAKSLWKYSENRIACFWLSLGLLKSFFFCWFPKWRFLSNTQQILPKTLMYATSMLKMWTQVFQWNKNFAHLKLKLNK